MKFRLSRTWDCDVFKQYPKIKENFDCEIKEVKGYVCDRKEIYITIDTLEDLIKLKAIVNQEIILTKDNKENHEIEIYDNYRE